MKHEGHYCHHEHHASPVAVSPEAAQGEGVMYTCPMHPQIRQPKPGNCPICGMALEPEKVSLDAAPNHELIDMTRRFWVSVILAAPLALFVMGAHLIPNIPHEWMDSSLSHWLQMLVATPVVLWGRLAVLCAGGGFHQTP